MDNGRNQPPRRRVSRAQLRRDEDYDEFDYDEFDYREEQRPRRRRSAPPPRTRARKKRRTWPVLLLGCGLGVLLTILGAAATVFFTIRTTSGNTPLPGLPVLPGNHPYNITEAQKLTLSGTLTQLQVCDKYGNVSINVDPTLTTATLTARKTVQAANQDAGTRALKNLQVQAGSPQTIASPSCSTPATTPTPTTNATPLPDSGNALTINVVFPGSTGTAGSNSSVNLALSLPAASVQSNGPTLALDVEAPAGNITVDGLSGLLTIRGGTGNVSVSHAALADNSQIDTSQGNVTFNGLLLFPTTANASAHYFIRSEQGKLDVTLPTNTNVTLDANTNVGSIKSDFPISVKPNSDGSANYHGPLVPTAGSTPDTVVLTVDVSTGDILIHQLQVSS